MNLTALIPAGLAVAALVACGPPTQTSVQPAACAQSPATGHYFGTSAFLRCDPTGAPYIVVDAPCGPLTIVTDDDCVRYLSVVKGTFVIGPPSAVQPGDVVFGGVG